MPYVRYRFKDADVWAKVDTTGALVTDRDGRAEIVYKPEVTAKAYRASPANLSAPSGPPVELSGGGAEKPSDTARQGATAPPAKPIPENAIQVWTDGGAAPNPGPSAAGVVIIDGELQTEVSEFLGVGTNQTAELTAILIGLTKVTPKDRPVVVYSDSAYSIGLLSMGWKAKANVELVERCRAACRQFKQLRFVKVAGHAGIPLNERVDALVGEAIRRGH